MIGGTNWAFRCRLSFETILYILTLGGFSLIYRVFNPKYR
jgi:hypothetical protein